MTAAGVAGLGWKPVDDALTPSELNDRHHLRLCLVCHPYDFLLDFYLYSLRRENGGGRLGQLRNGCESFREFVERYLFEIPGEVGELFFNHHADSYMRIDDCPKAFVELMQSIDLPEKQLAGLTKLIPFSVIVGPYTTKINRDLIRDVGLAEKRMMEEFNYHV